MKRKLLSLILAALLLASLLPTSALPVSAATETIKTVSVRAITPFAGQHPVFESKNYSSTTEDRTHNGYDIHTFTDAESGWKNGVMWLDRNGNVMTESDTFEAYQTYEVLVLVYAKEGYAFPKSPGTNVTAKVNDLAAKAATVGAGLKNGKDVIAIRYTFSCRKEKTVISKVSINMDMGQFETTMLLGEVLPNPEFSVEEGLGGQYLFDWYHTTEGQSGWEKQRKGTAVKEGRYMLEMKAYITAEHLAETYTFAKSVPFYLNGALVQTLDFSSEMTDYAKVAQYTVKPDEEVESLTVSPSNKKLAIGGTCQFAATILPTTLKNKRVIWSVEGANSELTEISDTGRLQISIYETPGIELTVTATSVVDPRVVAKATVFVDMQEAEKQVIYKVNLNADVPIEGEHPDYAVMVSNEESDVLDERVKYNIHRYENAALGWENGIRWCDQNGNIMDKSDVFEAAKTYELTVLVYAKFGYTFPYLVKFLTAKLNGNVASVSVAEESMAGEENVMAITYIFKAKKCIEKIAVEMDMSQIGDILTLGKDIRYPEFTVTEGSEAKVEASWSYREDENDVWTNIQNISTSKVKPGQYRLSLMPSILDEHLRENYAFPESVPFYLNGVQTDTLDYSRYYYDYTTIVEYTVPDGIPGDMDGDGDKDTDDAVYLLLNVMFGATDYPIANPDKDLNNDSKVNTDDAVYLLLHVMFGEEDYPI